MNYAKMERLRFIEFLLGQYGNFNRSAIMYYFGVGEAQATRDISCYSEIAPSNIDYDASARCYVKGREFERIYN